MNHLILCTWIVTLSLAVVAGQDRKSKPEEKLYPIGAFAGKVMKVEPDGKEFTLRVYGKTAEVTFTPGNLASC